MKSGKSVLLIIVFFILGVSLFIIDCSTKGGTGGITDPDDKTSPNVVQTIPPDMSMDIDPGTIISLFFDDALISSTVTTGSVQVTRQDTGATVAGQLFLSQSQSANTIVTFVPSQVLPTSTVIEVDLPSTGGVQDDGGNELLMPLGMSFQTAGTVTAAFPNTNWGFEQDGTGISFNGDGTRLQNAQGDITPNEESWMAAISSGEDFLDGGVVSGTEALDWTTSLLTTGDIATGGNNTLKFDYDFISAEFNEFVGSEFDDTFVIAIRGTTGVHSEVVTSVNIVGMVGNVPIALPTAFTDADSELEDAGRTGWTTKSINISSLGNPISIAFIVSDVSDDAWTTIVFIDNIRFE